jgi:hypothetical protein
MIMCCFSDCCKVAASGSICNAIDIDKIHSSSIGGFGWWQKIANCIFLP